MRLAANTGRKKSRKIRHLGTIAQLYRAISLQLTHVSTIGKKLLSSNISSRCPHNMVNFGPLAAEIDPVVCGTPANFNGFRILVALLHGILVVGVSQTLPRRTGCHLYSAGRPSSWALAHILLLNLKCTMCAKIVIYQNVLAYAIQYCNFITSPNSSYKYSKQQRHNINVRFITRLILRTND